MQKISFDKTAIYSFVHLLEFQLSSIAKDNEFSISFAICVSFPKQINDIIPCGFIFYISGTKFILNFILYMCYQLVTHVS